jgi:NAD(P)H dehydrogenase (quinone)
MYAITGVTGKVGGATARALLAAGQSVRAVVRNVDKGQVWRNLGCEVALATIEDEASLSVAFQRAEAVFVLVPPNFDPSPEFSEAREIAKALHSALAAARPKRVIYLSTIGAQAREMNLLTQHSIIEKAIGGLPIPITFLRPAWFMENCRWDVAPARETGVVPSFLQPLHKPVPMVATADIGKLTAGLLQEEWDGHRVIELEGPTRVTPNQIATTLAKLLGKPVRMKVVPRESWDALFRSQGMKNPVPRIRMLDGFNESWIEFERGKSGSQKGSTSLEAVLKSVIEEESSCAKLPRPTR